MKSNRIKTTLVVLSAIALALGILTAIVVFYPTGSYQPVIIQNVGTTTSFSNFTSTNASGTASGTAMGSATSTASSTATTTAGQFASSYASPYPVNWSDGGAAFSITGAQSTGNQITLLLEIQTGAATACVPMDLRLVTDEEGDLQAPDTAQFMFPDTGGCQGKPNATYDNQAVTFTLSASATSPFLFTTGGASSTFFEAATNTAGGVDIALPSQSG